jgi:uncharacterized membrane protein
MQVLIGVLQAIVLVTYPVAVYFGLSHFSTRGVGLLVLGAARAHARQGAPEPPRAADGHHGLPVAVAFLMLLAIASDDVRFVLAYPALVNLVLLLQFGFTLRRGSRAWWSAFARLQVDYLSPKEIEYCRVVTASWCGFFVLNGVACALFAALASRATWRSTPGCSATSSSAALRGGVHHPQVPLPPLRPGPARPLLRPGSSRRRRAMGRMAEGWRAPDSGPRAPGGWRRLVGGVVSS